MNRRSLRSAIAACAATLAMGLTGCGFQPLYGRPATLAALSRVQVVLPQGRSAFLLNEQLRDELVLDRDAPPLYRVDVKLEQVRTLIGVRVNNVATRYNLTLNAPYTVTSVATGNIIFGGFATATAGYDSADPPYAGVAASQSAEERAAQLLAVQLRLELARHLAGLPPP